MKTKVHSRKRKYVLTCDLEHKFSQLEHVGLKVPGGGFFDKFDEKIKEFIQSAYPDDEVVIFGVNQLAAEILSIATQKEAELDGFIVSTCADMAVPRRGATLEINRLFNSDGEFIGLGPRPGNLSLEMQLRRVASAAQRKPIILVEDGTFSGSTLSFITQWLKEYGANVQVIVVGFAFSKGMKKIREVFNGQIIAVNELDNLIDWMPDHDFFPFAPNGGRVLGVQVNGSHYPFYDHRGGSFSVPYVIPFVSSKKMEAWTSIPDINKLHFHFSSYCMEKAIEYYDALDKLNQKEVRVEHLMSVKPRVSTSIATNCLYLPAIQNEIAGYLHGINSECW